SAKRRIEVSLFPLFAFSFVPHGVHLFEIGLSEVAALGAEFFFDPTKATAKLGVGAPESGLWIDVEVASQVGIDKQDVAKFVLQAVLVAALGEFDRQLKHLFVELIEHIVGAWPIEADTCSSFLQFECAR